MQTYISFMRIAAFTVATGLYLDYWWQLAQDADVQLFPDQELTLIVFTDRHAEALERAKTFHRAKVEVVPTPTLTWPMATLARYQLISDMDLEDEYDVLIHLDADMRIAQKVGSELSPELWVSGIALVAHPGFYRPLTPIKTIFLMPRIAISDAAGFLRGEGGVGQWERRPQSTAFVSRSQRKTYVCGGVWFGRSREFLKMVKALAHHTQTDSKQGLIARWHDESHLNWYSSHHETTLLDPSYCYVAGSRNLQNLDARIIAVDKGDFRVRSQ
jgi:hypothetical protein